MGKCWDQSLLLNELGHQVCRRWLEGTGVGWKGWGAFTDHGFPIGNKDRWMLSLQDPNFSWSLITSICHGYRSNSKSKTFICMPLALNIINHNRAVRSWSVSVLQMFKKPAFTQFMLPSLCVCLITEIHRLNFCSFTFLTPDNNDGPFCSQCSISRMMDHQLARIKGTTMGINGVLGRQMWNGMCIWWNHPCIFSSHIFWATPTTGDNTVLLGFSPSNGCFRVNDVK